jgi:hypothetical protein
MTSVEEKKGIIRRALRSAREAGHFSFWPMQVDWSTPADCLPLPNPEPSRYFPKSPPAVSLATYLVTRMPARRT